jgi:hypothetical protein
MGGRGGIVDMGINFSGPHKWKGISRSAVRLPPYPKETALCVTLSKRNCVMQLLEIRIYAVP